MRSKSVKPVVEYLPQLWRSFQTFDKIALIMVTVVRLETSDFQQVVWVTDWRCRV